MREQRRHERVTSRLRCWCEGENVTFYARVADVSEGGLFLRTLTPLGQGARVRLRFPLAGAGDLAAWATVRWCREEGAEGPAGMGLAFEPLAQEAQGRLRSLVARERSSASGRAAALVAGPVGV